MDDDGRRWVMNIDGEDGCWMVDDDDDDEYDDRDGE